MIQLTGGKCYLCGAEWEGYQNHYCAQIQAFTEASNEERTQALLLAMSTILREIKDLIKEKLSEQ